MNPPGVYYGMPESEYRADAGVSQSDLKLFQRSPAHYKAGEEPDEDAEESDALILGRMVGQIAIEPDRAPWWVVRPDGLKMNTKAGKQWKAELPPGLEPVTQAMFSNAGRMATALLDHPVAGEIVRNSAREVSVFDEYQTNYGIIRRKARLDLVTAGTVLADIKTTVDAREDAFRKSVKKFGYDIQAWSYRDIWNARNPENQKPYFFFIAIEKKPPFAIMIHDMDELFLARGENQYRELIEEFARCQQEDKWPGYTENINKLTP